MRLKKLEILGFKSFLEKTAVHFPAGVSAIVGPNGCGKSNIVDALRWVMGEQSVKQLRGKSMEDIIFAGTNGKAPLNMAEVSLTVDNNNGSVPEELRDYSEIMVTRRLYRSGESAFFINKQPCRLKDIHHLFMGSGMGAKTYAIIQQGNVGAITDASPEERRLYIEEAAGVTRYKNRKNEALRKVFTTNQNLMRVADIITEVKRRMNSLNRQAKTAERYKRYQAEVRRLDMIRSLQRFDRFQELINETQTVLSDRQKTEAEQNTQLKKLDAAVEEIKLRRWEKNQEISEQRTRKFDLQRQLDRLEKDLQYLNAETDRLGTEAKSLEAARRDIEAKNQEMGDEIAQVEAQQGLLTAQIDAGRQDLAREKAAADELKARLAEREKNLESRKAALMELVAREARFRNVYQNANSNRENLQRRLKKSLEEEHLARQKVERISEEEAKAQKAMADIRSEMQALKEEIAKLQKTLAEKNDLLGRQVKTVHTLELERNQARSKHQTLKKMEENFEWYREGVQAIMRRHGTEAREGGDEGAAPKPADVLGLMADIIDPQPAFATAVEAVLGEALQYILVSDMAAGVDCIHYLQSRQAGRSGFIPLPAVRPQPAVEPLADASATPLLSHVAVKAGFEPVAQALLGHVVVTENLEDALGLFQRNGHQRVIVTKAGETVSHQGLLTGGSQEKLAGILAKKHEIKSLHRRIQQLDQDLETARQRQKTMETEIWDLESGLQKLLARKNDKARDEIETEKRLYQITENLRHARRHLDIVQLEQEQLAGEETDLDQEIDRHAAVLQTVEKEVRAAREEVAEAGRDLTDLGGQLEGFNQRAMAIQLSQTELTAKQENSRNTLRRLCQYRDENIRRIDQITLEIAQKQQKQVQSRQKIAENEAKLKEMYETLQGLDRRLETNQADYQSIDANLQESDRQIAAIKKVHEETLDHIRNLEREQSERRIKQENIAQGLQERYAAQMSDLREEVQQHLSEDESLASLGEDEIEAQLADFRSKIEKIGDVNLGAIKEYEELEERHQFLTDQHDDLVMALEDLNKVIRKINKISQQRFLETFNLINEKLDEVFPRLFEGGTAKLVLTEPAKPLESGVEFMIHPPGKKLTRMSLLSGGEKALSAIALIFSIFLIKPASFCLMDEIDAPLDEANIYRFNELLKIIGEKSQIIMVTHNKRSMEFADRLFGITMETKGISKVVSVNLNKIQAAA